MSDALQRKFFNRLKGRVQRKKKITLARKIHKIEKRLGDAEEKIINSQQTNKSVTTTPIIDQLTNIDQGVSALQRLGSKLTIKSIYFKLRLRANNAAVASMVRVMLVQDRQTNEAVFTSGDLLYDDSAYDNIVSIRDLDNMSRFRVLMDRTYVMSDQLAVYDTYFKKVNIPLRFNGNLGNIADLTHNSLALVYMTDDATFIPSITYNLNLRFVDE